MTAPTEDPRARDAVAEGAALIIAQAAGDNAHIDALLRFMWDERDTQGAIITLRAVLVAAGRAMEAEVRRVNEEGGASPASDQLVALASLNHQGSTDD